MFYKKEKNVYILRPEVGEDIPEVIRQLSEKENITCAQVSGIGATSTATVGCYSPAEGKYLEKTFNEPMEIVSLLGNVSRRDGKAYVHLHASFSGVDCNVVGGHLLKAIVGITGEIFITTADTELKRILNPANNGLTILDV